MCFMCVWRVYYVFYVYMGQVPEIKLMMIKHTGPVTLADDAWVRIVLWADEGRGPKRQSVGICGLATTRKR